MTVTVRQFVRSLNRSGLLSADAIKAFRKSLPRDGKPKDGADLARELVRRKKLTRFQAQAIYQGKTRLILGDYVVLDRIGQRGVCQVFKAEDRTTERVVTLRTLPVSATESEKAVQRLHREAQIAAGLSHPNILAAYEAGESHGVHYLVTEYVEGTDLSDLVGTRGRLPVSTALDYTIQAARGLEYAHGRKVIHRDIKPASLLLDDQGMVKVLDMGLARWSRSNGPEDTTGRETPTGTGQAISAIDFISPEQAQNVNAGDERTDVYSLGCTLYYLLTGKAIYRGHTAVMKLLAHREARIPSLRAERPDVPERLDEVYQKMVAKRPDDRYASMAAVIIDLEICAGAKPDQPAETADLGEAPASSAHVGTSPAANTEETHDDDSLPLDSPVISPVDTLIQKRAAKENKKAIYGAVAAAVAFLVIVLLVLFMLREKQHPNSPPSLPLPPSPSRQDHPKGPVDGTQHALAGGAFNSEDFAVHNTFQSPPTHHSTIRTIANDV